MRAIAWGLVVLFMGTTSAFALPVLQLDSPDGTYVGADPDPVKNESTVVMSDQFTVYAYGTPSGNTSATDIIDGSYVMSIAVVPQTIPPGGNLGSFTINGQTINVTADMVFGTPPVETLGGDQGTDPGDLPTHGVFETYFIEVEVDFVAGDQVTPYDAQTDGQVTPDLRQRHVLRRIRRGHVRFG